jgi:ribonuclease-3
MQVAEKFILNIWGEFLEKSIETKIDAKTQLQEYSLKKFKTLPIYTIQKQSGPQHSPIFKVEVHIKNSKKCYASGTSKKNAQQNAAQKLLINLKLSK